MGHLERTDQDNTDITTRVEDEVKLMGNDRHEGCAIIETYNAHGVTKAPSPLTHSSLHLIVASKVEPSSSGRNQSLLGKRLRRDYFKKI